MWKKTIPLLVVSLVLGVWAQDESVDVKWGRSVGVWLGSDSRNGFSWGVDVQGRIKGEHRRLEFGFRSFGKAMVLYEYCNKIKDDLVLYVGGGLSFGAVPDEPHTGYGYGFLLPLGMDFDLKKRNVPLRLSINYCPSYFAAMQGISGYQGEIGVGIKYLFPGSNGMD